MSVGVVNSKPALDLCYLEDSTADVDMNVVMTGSGQLVEIQGTAESAPFSTKTLDDLIALSKTGIERLIAAQKEMLGSARVR